MDSAKLKRRIKSQMELYGYSSENMAVRMHMTTQAWYRRLREPEKISVGELCRLDKILKMKLFTEESA